MSISRAKGLSMFNRNKTVIDLIKHLFIYLFIMVYEIMFSLTQNNYVASKNVDYLIYKW